ncbi:hypothetical protein ACFXPA_27625 [Amycolatopsis sp. NPDC059090]|uniref:hypothetical protein n=1 Tax=Amycolatopsis sp. NPDC059090 TaxID=3346723 RepID=UPI00366F4F0E
MSSLDIALRASGDVLDGARQHVLRETESFARRVGGDVAAVRIRLAGFRQPWLVRSVMTLSESGSGAGFVVR